MKYKVNFKAQDAKSPDWNDIVRLRDRVTAYMNSKGYHIEGDTDLRMMFVSGRNKIEIGHRFVTVVVNYDDMTIHRGIYILEEDSVHLYKYFPFHSTELFKFFDDLGFEIDKEMTAQTGEKIDDWFWEVKKK